MLFGNTNVKSEIIKDSKIIKDLKSDSCGFAPVQLN